MTQPYRHAHLGSQLPTLHHILVATDFDPTSNGAVEMGAALARDAGASIHLLCVLEAIMYSPPDMAALAERDPDLHPEVSRNMTNTVRRLQELGLENVTGNVEFGIAADVIVRYASSAKYDLLVVGSRGKGNTSGHVLARATVPILVVPAKGTSHGHA